MQLSHQNTLYNGFENKSEALSIKGDRHGLTSAPTKNEPSLSDFKQLEENPSIFMRRQESERTAGVGNGATKIRPLSAPEAKRPKSAASSRPFSGRPSTRQSRPSNSATVGSAVPSTVPSARSRKTQTARFNLDRFKIEQVYPSDR